MKKILIKYKRVVFFGLSCDNYYNNPNFFGFELLKHFLINLCGKNRDWLNPLDPVITWD